MQFSVSRLLKEDHEEKMRRIGSRWSEIAVGLKSLLIGDFTNGPFACFKRNPIPVKIAQAASSISRTLQVLKSTIRWTLGCGAGLVAFPSQQLALCFGVQVN